LKFFVINDPDNVWLIKAHSLALTGNGAALILLGSFMNKSAIPIAALQSNVNYFLPFVCGVLAAGLASFFGIICSNEFQLEQKQISTLKNAIENPKSHEGLILSGMRQRAFENLLSADGEEESEGIQISTTEIEQIPNEVKDIVDSRFASMTMRVKNRHKKKKNFFGTTSLTLVIISSACFIVGLVAVGYM